MRRPLIALTLAGGLMVALPTGAQHTLAAEHIPPAVAIDGEPLTLDVAAMTTCAIAYCGWVTATVYYQDPDGSPASTWVEGPYERAVQLLRPSVPAAHVAGPVFSYTIVVRQQDCLGDCHLHEVRLPRMGESYVVRVEG